MHEHRLRDEQLGQSGWPLEHDWEQTPKQVSPGKVTLTSKLQRSPSADAIARSVVQLMAHPGGATAAVDPFAVADLAVPGASTAQPHLDRIQAAFGHHDVREATSAPVQRDGDDRCDVEDLACEDEAWCDMDDRADEPLGAPRPDVAAPIIPVIAADTDSSEFEVVRRELVEGTLVDDDGTPDPDRAARFELVAGANAAAESGGRYRRSEAPTTAGRPASLGRAQLLVSYQVNYALNYLRGRSGDSDSGEAVSPAERPAIDHAAALLRAAGLDQGQLLDIRQRGQRAEAWAGLMDLPDPATISDERDRRRVTGLLERYTPTITELIGAAGVADLRAHAVSGDVAHVETTYGDAYEESVPGTTDTPMARGDLGRMHGFGALTRGWDSFETRWAAFARHNRAQSRAVARELAAAARAAHTPVDADAAQRQATERVLAAPTTPFATEDADIVRMVRDDHTLTIETMSRCAGAALRARFRQAHPELEAAATSRVATTADENPMTADTVDRPLRTAIGGEERAGWYTRGAMTSPHWSGFAAILPELDRVTSEERHLANFTAAQTAAAPLLTETTGRSQDLLVGQMARVRHGGPAQFAEWFTTRRGRGGRADTPPTVQTLAQYRGLLADLSSAESDTNRGNGIRAFTRFFIYQNQLFDHATGLPTIDTFLPDATNQIIARNILADEATRLAREARRSAARTPRRAGGAPGRRGRGRAAPPVMPEGGATGGAGFVHAAAAAGVAGAPSTLPHLDVIQRAFGHHDVTEIRAHVGGPAGAASRAIGARAYATGNDVAFSAAPDLHQTAHEAAHVVQQRGGVQLDAGVGRRGDTYEQHADEVADAVVRGDSAEAVLDRHAPGRGASSASSASSTAAALQREVETTHFGATGRYGSASAGDLLVEINQAGHLIVGHYESRHPGYLGRADLSRGRFEGDMGWDNDGSTGYRIQGTPERPAADRPFTGTMVVSAGGHLRFERAGHDAVALTRLGTAAFVPAADATGLAALDVAAIAEPLTEAQRARVEVLRGEVVTAVTAFYGDRGVVRDAAISTLDRQVRETFEAIPPTQQPSFRAAARETFSAGTVSINGMQWSELDWLSAVCLQLREPALARDIERYLGVPTGTASEGDGMVYRYRIRLDVFGAGGELVEGGGGEASAHLGRMHVVAAEPYRRGEAPPAFTPRWERSFGVGQAGLSAEIGEAVGGSVGEASEGVVESPFPWEPLDFQGPFGGGGIEVSVGAEGMLGGLAGGPSDTAQLLRGSGVYPALDISGLTSQLYGEEGGATLGIEATAGYIVDPDVGDSTVREPIADGGAGHTRHVTGVGHVNMAFATASHDLTEAGRAGLRHALAVNRRALEGAGATIEIYGHASLRRRSVRYDNLALSQRRADAVATGCREILVGLAPHLIAIGRGTAEAEANGRASDDNDWFYRRADVRIAGEIVLRLHGEPESDTPIESDEGLTDAHDPDQDVAAGD